MLLPAGLSSREESVSSGAVTTNCESGLVLYAPPPISSRLIADSIVSMDIYVFYVVLNKEKGQPV